MSRRTRYLGLALVCLVASPALATSRVRVAHLSPDAPPVDVWANGARVISSLAYLESTDYLSLDPGAVDVAVTPAGETEPRVIAATLELAADTAYTIAATGLLGEDDLAPLVLVDDRDASEGDAKVRFTHASPDAPPVDVALKDGDVLFANVSFRESEGYLTVPGGTYELEVRLAGTDTVALDLGPVVLPAGVNLEVFATGLVSDETLGALPVITFEPRVLSAYIRVAHLSPDAPDVDVRVDGVVVLSDVPYSTISGYLPLAAGPYRVQVTPAGLTEPVVIDETLTLEGGSSYTVAATGLLGEEDLAPIVLVDDRLAVADSAKVRFVHSSPDAPNVDITLTDGTILFGDVSFRASSGPIEVPAGVYDLEVRVAGTDQVALPLPGVALSAGTNVSVFAIGLLADESLGALSALDVDETFLRGDANRDGSHNIADPVSVLQTLFVAPVASFCEDAADANDDGHLTLTDAVYSLDFLFRGGAQPASPYPEKGADATEDSLGCTFRQL